MLIWTIATGRSKPYLLAWGIRFTLVVVAFVSQFMAGTTHSLALSGSQMLGITIVIGLIIFMQPTLGRLERPDWVAVGTAGLGVVIWLASGNPLYGVLGVIMADMAATALGIHASIRRGARESLAFWMCAFVAGFMATLSIAGTLNLAVLLIPLFSCINAAVNVAAWWYVYRRDARQVMPAKEPLLSEFDAA